MIKYKWNVPKAPIFHSKEAATYFKNNRLKIFSSIMPVLQSGVVSSTPVGASGLLRKSFVITYGKDARLTSSLQYAAAVNDGRRAAPVDLSAKEGIIKWIRLTNRGQAYFAALREKYKKITHEQAAFLLMRSKKRRKTPGQFFFEAGLESVQKVVRGVYVRILKDMANGLTGST